MSWLFLLNFIVLQWTGYRLARVFDEENNFLGWTFVKFKPLTGWKLK